MQALEAALWKDAAARAIIDAPRTVTTALDGVTIGQRKTYTAFSRGYQFAAVRPRGRGALLGLALPPDADPHLAPVSGRAVWSERPAAEVLLHDPAEVPSLASLLSAAWVRS